jgi:hypothetical protein
MTELFLPNNVHFCDTYAGGVFLNVLADEYLVIGAADLTALRAFMANPAATTSEGCALVNELTALQLVTTSGHGHRKLISARRDIPQSSLLDDCFDARPPFRVLELLAFLLAVTSALMLSKISLSGTVSYVHSRRRRSTFLGCEEDLDTARLTHLVRVFRYLRPFFFKAQDGCLFSSLVLLQFLRLHRIQPAWVFGVKTMPFEAHCWIEHSGTLLSGRHEHLSGFVPIMTV